MEQHQNGLNKDLNTMIALLGKINVKIPQNASAFKSYVVSSGVFGPDLKGVLLPRLEQLEKGDAVSSCMICQQGDVSNGVICQECIRKAQTMQPVSIVEQIQNAEGTQKTADVQTSQKEETPETLQNILVSGAKIEKSIKETTKLAANTLAEKMNVMSGGEGKVDLRFKDFFVNVPVKHTKEESDEIFVCGTKTTTPAKENITSDWPKPWLYSRVALAMITVFGILLVSYIIFNNTNLIPGILLIGSFAIPVSLLVFFFEVNVPRNISFTSVLLVFFLGGSASLFTTLTLFAFIPVDSLGYIEAILVGLIEEIGKLLIVAICIRREKECSYILNGMLYGAAVGAGFAAFETAGYVMHFGMSDGAEGFMITLLVRAALSPGGHIAWAAISGAALMIVKNNREFEWKILKSPKLWMIFIWPVGMHAAWDMPIDLLRIGPFTAHRILLVIIAWIMIIVLLNRGLSEINRQAVFSKKNENVQQVAMSDVSTNEDGAYDNKNDEDTSGYSKITNKIPKSKQRSINSVSRKRWMIAAACLVSLIIAGTLFGSLGKRVKPGAKDSTTGTMDTKEDGPEVQRSIGSVNSEEDAKACIAAILPEGARIYGVGETEVGKTYFSMNVGETLTEMLQRGERGDGSQVKAYYIDAGRRGESSTLFMVSSDGIIVGKGPLVGVDEWYRLF